MSFGDHREGRFDPFPVHAPHDLPLTDAAHVRMALMRWQQMTFASEEVRIEVARRILAACRRLGR